MTCCGDDPSGPLCIHQIHFLQILCVRLNKDPRLADFFMKVKLFKILDASDVLALSCRKMKGEKNLFC